MAQFQPGSNLYTQGNGSRAENVEVPVIQSRAPATSDSDYPVGKVWVDSTNNASYILTSLSSSGGTVFGTWTAQGGGAAQVSTLSGDTGTATPSSGDIEIAGTSNQLTTAATGATVTLSLPTSLTAPGSVTATTSITAVLGDITATNGDFVLSTAGNKLNIAAGSNASVGQSTLTAGTVTVSTTAVTSNSLIFLTRGSIGSTGAAATGNLAVGTITNGTSFVINSLDPTDATALATTDVSDINWLIIN